MGKKKEADDTAVESTEAGSTKGKKIILTNVSTGEQIGRADYIKKRFFQDGVKRGEIRKELKELFGHDVQYQIVFAATKTPKAANTDAPAAAEAAE